MHHFQWYSSIQVCGAAGTEQGYMAKVRGAAAARNLREGASCAGQRSLSSWHSPDSYAFGVMLWELLTLRQPWGHLGPDDVQELWAQVLAGERPRATAEELAGAPHKDYVKLMEDCWQQDAARRPTFREARRRLQKIAS